MRGFGWAALLAVAAVTWPATAPAADEFDVTASGQAPTLGVVWAPSQSGYGKIRPRKIFNGGDPTGLVTHVRWRGWGGRRAIGRGRAEYVWPGTGVASNRDTGGARVVAFHLGICDGHRAYKAITWFFPKYGERFNPRSYINICTGAYRHPRGPKLRSCSDVTMTRYDVLAEYVQASGTRCTAARRFIRRLRVGSLYEPKVHKWTTRSGWRCGTDGYNPEFTDDESFGCAKGRRSVFFSV